MRSFAAIALLVLAGAAPAVAATPPCAPCAGIVLDDPYAELGALAASPALAKDAHLAFAWEMPLDASATPAGARAVAAAGGEPWLRLVFRTPAPLLEHLERLQGEIAIAAELARTAGDRAHFQIFWRPEGQDSSPLDARQYAFLLKRAAVAITGAAPDAPVATMPLVGDETWLRTFYGEEVAAYLDGVAFVPRDASASGADPRLAALAELDPGRAAILDAIALPADTALALPAAALGAVAGFERVFFRAAAAPAAKDLAPLKVLANEFAGELAYDANSAPGGVSGWVFVRGKDLGLRVVAAAPEGAKQLSLSFPDPTLREPSVVRLGTGEAVPIPSYRRTETGLEVEVANPRAAVVLRVARASVEELKGVEEKVTVAGERQMPVEEILRRLQAFEDAQTRRLYHYQAVNSTTLRFQAASGVQTIEATFEGELFYRQGQPFDWAWQSFYINGVKWRGKSIPEIPLVQPEKAAAMPLEILFTKEYRYSLRGSERLAGRDCWVVDFAPNVAVVEGRTLYKGSVWVDKQIYARVRSRAVQLGLTGEVISNEETMEYSPIEAGGATAPWSADAFVLPLRVTGQQILSVVNTATVVEKEVRLSHLSINGPEFDERREAVLASAATMVRDTAGGLRYLVKDTATGERQVKEGFDTNKLFALGGVFYDESLSYPIPLVGLNYFDLDFHGGKRQLNAFWGGVLGIVNYADPRFLGSKLDLGVDVFAIALASTDQLFRSGEQSKGEEVKELPARVTVNFGFPLGNFLKVNSSYRLAYSKFSSTDNTADDFVLPSDHLRHRFDLGLQYARGGYRLNVEGAYNLRSKWDFWGPPGNPEFDPDAEKYATWEASAAKNWYLPNFQKFGLEVNYFGGSNLDRFSKYQFGFFGGNRVHGYQIGKVRAEKGYAAHVTYGFEVGKLLRLDAVGDAAWATDKVSGYDHELLAGVGLQGTFMGPWETLVNVDVGTPVAGPDTGFVAYVVFLKLFK